MSRPQEGMTIWMCVTISQNTLWQTTLAMCSAHSQLSHIFPHFNLPFSCQSQLRKRWRHNVSRDIVASAAFHSRPRRHTTSLIKKEGEFVQRGPILKPTESPSDRQSKIPQLSLVHWGQSWNCSIIVLNTGSSKSCGKKKATQCA